MHTKKHFKAVVIGVSTGGLNALTTILPLLPTDYSLPVIIVQHIREDMRCTLAEILTDRINIAVCEIYDKQPIKKGMVYFAPPGYHTLVEDEDILSLSVDPKVNYARPSVDVLFESAADVYQENLVGVILTGANSDGALGLKKIKFLGGHTIVQDPTTAAVADMPQAAIDIVEVDQILTLSEVGLCLAQLNSAKNQSLISNKSKGVKA